MNNNEPVILGKVKKGSAGKPLVVIILFLFIGSFILFLPNIMNYFGEYSIIDLIKNGQIIDFFVNHDNYVDKPINDNKNTQEFNELKPLLINNKTELKENNFKLNNFTLTKDKIKFTINTTTQINFDESNYYLVLSQNDKEIKTIKLTETILNTKEITYIFKEKLNSTLEVKGIIKIIKENDYPKFIVTSDESGLGSLICEKDNYKIEYIFSNNSLNRIKETYNYIDNGNDYLTTFEEYSNKVNRLNNSNATASIIEDYSGFIFTTDIDLSKFTGTEKNYNYYSLNTKTNKINFEMNAKGYDCK